MENLVINGQETDILSYRDKNGKPLHFKVIGLYVILLHWNKLTDKPITLQNIAEQLDCGTDTIRMAINELINTGYLDRQLVKKNGRFNSAGYTIYLESNTKES